MSRWLVREPSTPRSRASGFMSKACGYTLLELVFVTGVVTLTAAIAVPQAFATIERSRALAATHHLSAQMALARTQAVAGGATLALRFDIVNGAMAYTVFRDGNRNGVRTADINSGIDRPIAASAAIGDSFARVTIANGT